MSSSTILNEAQIVSGRDIPLKELLFAKRVLDNYTVVAQKRCPDELLSEMKEAVESIEYFKTTNDPCEARNVISGMLNGVAEVASFEAFITFTQIPTQALHELIVDRAELIKQERELLVGSGYEIF
ncbi:hypothetical protein [Thaumasiovibrio subtropicus]|uniref:hypothetical protein n=1 Tax=Thaumasiovibrio subtropicus TaxID=1891207 RepID=UPI000B355CE8|nr:hypothetical protein [Thaumasiovibrio subtropicus]